MVELGSNYIGICGVGDNEFGVCCACYEVGVCATVVDF